MTDEQIVMHSTPKISVVGSINVDFFLKMRRMPQLGETLASDSMVRAYGGKVSLQSRS